MTWPGLYGMLRPMNLPLSNALFVADLDGTVAQSDRTISPVIQEGFKRLGAQGVTRVIATGRVLRSALGMLEHALEFDYLVFSNGAGTLDWPTRTLRNVSALMPDEVNRITTCLKEQGLDFMVLNPIPDNHRFLYYRSGVPNADFEQRLDIYRNEAIPLTEPHPPLGEASEIIAIIRPEIARASFAELSKLLSPDFSLVRTTSPLDYQSLWLEIFSCGVGKGPASEKLRSELGIEDHRTVAVGNDYNDLDLLDWAENAFVVANSPGDLQKAYVRVPSNDQHGVMHAIDFCLGLLP